MKNNQTCFYAKNSLEKMQKKIVDLRNSGKKNFRIFFIEYSLKNVKNIFRLKDLLKKIQYKF